VAGEVQTIDEEIKHKGEEIARINGSLRTVGT